MRRTGNTSVSPTIGIVVVPTGKIDFGPACAAAAPPCMAVPASASAPVARMVLRSTLLIGASLFCESSSDQCLQRFQVDGDTVCALLHRNVLRAAGGIRKTIPALDNGPTKGPRCRGPSHDRTER